MANFIYIASQFLSCLKKIFFTRGVVDILVCFFLTKIPIFILFSWSSATRLR